LLKLLARSCWFCVFGCLRWLFVSTASTMSTLTSATSALRGYHLLDKPLRLPFQPQHLRRIDGCNYGGDVICSAYSPVASSACSHCDCWGMLEYIRQLRIWLV
jgi:hypothetical protein